MQTENSQLSRSIYTRATNHQEVQQVVRESLQRPLKVTGPTRKHDVTTKCNNQVETHDPRKRGFRSMAALERRKNLRKTIRRICRRNVRFYKGARIPTPVGEQERVRKQGQIFAKKDSHRSLFTNARPSCVQIPKRLSFLERPRGLTRDRRVMGGDPPHGGITLPQANDNEPTRCMYSLCAIQHWSTRQNW